MKRNSTALANTEYDLIIVGGGIFGVCSAWDAASRGLRVALIEQNDFGQSVSANYFKAAQSGIRSLQQLDILRIRELCAERSALLRIAPHLVQPMPFVIPTYGHGMESRELMMAALTMYDACTFDRNHGISDPKQHIPRSRTISRGETLQLFPQLQNKSLTGAAIFYDGQMHSPSRLSLAYAQSAVEAGADAVNYTKVIEFLRASDDEKAAITGVVVQDRLTGDQYEVRGKLVLNTTGLWSKWLPSVQKKSALHDESISSHDAYFVIHRKLVDSHALALRSHVKESNAASNAASKATSNQASNAASSRANRHLFLIPWRDYTLFGVWHTVSGEKPEEFKITDADLQKFIDEVNIACPELKIEADEVSMWNADSTFAGEDKSQANAPIYRKQSVLIDHAADHGISGLISLTGARFATSRSMAEKAINLAFKRLGIEVPVCKTRIKSLYGGNFETFDGLVHEATIRCPSSIDKDILTSIIHNHGSNYSKLFGYVEKNPALGERIGETMSIKADVIHAIRSEMAQNLGDIVFRRTDMGIGSHPGIEALQISAELMATELGWTDVRKYHELSEVEKMFPNLRVSKDTFSNSVEQAQLS